MAGHTVVLNLLGGIALLVWAMRMLRTGITRGFGDRLRAIVGQATRNTALSCGAGFAVTLALQSSTATTMILATFAERGIIALPAALAAVLGADLGSTIVVQFLSFDVSFLTPALLIAGVAAFMTTGQRLKQVGRALIALALVLVALGMIVGASEPLRGNPLIAEVLDHLGGDPILAIGVAALLTWLFHSSVAMVLLIVALASGGVVQPQLALPLVLGANVGAGLIAIGLTTATPVEARRIVYGNALFRLAGALVGLALLAPATAAIGAFDPAPGRQVANFHTLFNLALIVVGLPFTGLAARLLTHLLKAPQAAAVAEVPDRLEDSLLDQPWIAIAEATREVVRLADMIERMLRQSLLAFEDGTPEQRRDISRLDDEVDRLQERIKLFLTRLMRRPLSPEEGQRVMQIILFTTDLEHVGDIIDKNLLGLAAKKRRNQVAFSEAGWAEIVALHTRVLDQMRLAMSVFVKPDVVIARRLVLEKEEMRNAERLAARSHFERLRQGAVASIETSALHLDILRDLKRIVAHLTSVAHPILEQEGELRSSRLRQENGSATAA